MMGDPAVKEATYADLLGVPENRVDEIINGELHTMPRRSFRHSNVVSVLVDELGIPLIIKQRVNTDSSGVQKNEA